MESMLSIRLDLRMKLALEKLAEKQFVSVAALVKQAVEKHLQENGIDWRSEKPRKK
jgi:predicted DNA-binding protein